MVELNLSLGKHSQGSIKLKGFVGDLSKNLERGMRKAGVLLEGTMKQNVMGGGNKLNVRTGRLRGSIQHVYRNTTGGPQVRIGPGVVYAAIHEFGGHAGRNHATYIPPRPYIKPTWRKDGDKAVTAIQREIAKPLAR